MGAPAQTIVTAELLNREHPEYTLYKNAWQRFELLHASGVRLQAAAQEFLVRRPKEVSGVYQERVKRFINQNILGALCGWYVAKLYQREPKIEIQGDEAFFKDFVANCDVKGTSFIEFDAKVFLSQLLYGKAYVLVDKPKADAPIEDRGEEIAAGLDKPYLVLYEPLQVINWEVDEFGTLEWVVIRCSEIEQDGPLGKASMKICWYIFDRQEFTKYEAQTDGTGTLNAKATVTLVDGPRPHVLASKNRVPVRCLDVPDSLWLTNRSYLQLLAHLDVENTYDWKLFMSNLAQLVISGEADVTGLKLSETGFLLLPDAASKAYFLEPSATTFEESRLRLQNLREEIYRQWYLQAQGRSSSATAAASSGYSKELDMVPANDVLNRFGDLRREQMKAELQDIADALGVTVVVNVNGFRFETRSVLESVERAESVQNLGIQSETLEKVLDKQVAMDALDGESQEIKDAVMSEIDAAPSRTKMAAQNQQLQQQGFQVSLDKAASKGIIQAQQASVAA